jgi:tetratricopeptide (TPR) repeat protein
MTNPYGPWATALDAGRYPQLSAFWRQRLTMLVPASRTSPALSRRNLLALVAAAALVCGLPTFHAAPAVAEQEKVSQGQGQDQRTDSVAKRPGTAVSSPKVVAGAAKEAFERGQACFQEKDYEAAMAAFGEAIRLDYDAAMAAFGEAIRLDPDNWSLFNDIAVCLWKQAENEDAEAAKAEAAGDMETAKARRQKSARLKDDAKAQWIHGVTVSPTATDIHRNLGYAYAEASSVAQAAGDLKQAEQDIQQAELHLTEAVKLKPISSRPHYNLGRVLLRRSRQYDTDAREAEAKGDTEATKKLKVEAQVKLDAGIAEFERAVALDPSFLEARLNLGEVYLSLNDPDKAEIQFRGIVERTSENVKDRETINNFSQAYFGLARVDLIRENPDNAIQHLQKAIELNPQNPAALQLLAAQRFERGEYREGEKSLWPLLAGMPAQQRRYVAEQFGVQFQSAGKEAQALRAWNFFGWAFATSPDSHILDPQEAMKLAQRVVEMTKQQDPVSADTLAAAQAASGKYDEAVRGAKTALDLANSQGNKPLAEAVSRRLQLYQQGKPYECDPSGGDRP